MSRRSMLGSGGGLLLAPATGAAGARAWWRNAVFYKVYTRSFQDTTGDGVGDLPGVAARLDRLARLGIDAVWLSPHFDSPDAANGHP